MIDIELKGVRKTYGSGSQRVAAVDGIDLRVEPGELFFLLGPSGCGKTTLLRMIAGLIDPDGGKVLFAGRDVTHTPVENRNTAMVFQNYALWPHMTVNQNVRFGPKMRGKGSGEQTQLARESLARVQMEDHASRKPNQLSGGQQQRVAVARALAARADCLLLDEPLSNLDARLRLHMRGELRRLVKDTGTTAVYVTHDQKEALSMADRIAVMLRGRIVQTGTPQELYDRPASRFVADFLGEANFLPARVLGPSDGQVEMETTCGNVRAAAGPAAPAKGETALLCVRPERVRLSDRPPDGEPALACEIVHCTFLGELRQYVVRLADATEWRVTELTTPAFPLAPGAKTQVTFRPLDAVVLPEGQP